MSELGGVIAVQTSQRQRQKERGSRLCVLVWWREQILCTSEVECCWGREKERGIGKREVKLKCMSHDFMACQV